MNALVVGVSADKPAAQLKFIEKYALSFPMVPDPDKVIISSYGTQTVLGIAAQRATFLVGPDGKIAHVWPKVTLNGHADDVVATIGRLAGA